MSRQVSSRVGFGRTRRGGSTSSSPCNALPAACLIVELCGTVEETKCFLFLPLLISELDQQGNSFFHVGWNFRIGFLHIFSLSLFVRIFLFAGVRFSFTTNFSQVKQIRCQRVHWQWKRTMWSDLFPAFFRWVMWQWKFHCIFLQGLLYSKMS